MCFKILFNKKHKIFVDWSSIMQKFPEDFIFALSTTAFQIEGGRLLGGRKHSIWDRFTIENYHIPPAGLAEREINSIAVAADFYHRYPQDIRIMHQIGINALVYTIDWTRIFPDDNEHINQAGIDFYKQLFQSLIEHKIKPIIVLYQCDIPLWLEEQGGASGPAFLEAFENFVQTAFKHFGQYSDLWFVQNENNKFTVNGYLGDYYPPGKKSSVHFWKAIYYLAIAAALGQRAFTYAKTQGWIKQGSRLGIGHSWTPTIAYDFADFDHQSACSLYDEYNLDLFLEPNLLGQFPDCFYKEMEQQGLMKIVSKAHLDLLAKHKLNLIGLNYYYPVIVAHPKFTHHQPQWFHEPQKFITNQAYVVYPPEQTYTTWKWLVKSDCLVNASIELWSKYQQPLMILSNGLGTFDPQRQGEIIFDEYRIDYLNKHLQEIQKAISKGVNYIGYAAWTYCDVFSPSGGYRKRYGLVEVNFDDPNLQRLPKASMFWYQDVIRNRTTFKPSEMNLQKYLELAQQSWQTDPVWKHKN